MNRNVVIAILGFVTLAACSLSKSPSPFIANGTIAALRPLTTDERVADFRALVSLMRNYYGPLEYKEQRFQFSFDVWAAETEEKVRQAKSDEEVFGFYSQFIARFQDGHLGIEYPLNPSGIDAYTVPVFLTFIEDKTLIANIDSEFKDHQMKVGDEVLLIDGRAPADYLKIIGKYANFGSAETNKHLIFLALHRPVHFTDLRPNSNATKLIIERPDGTRYTQELLWVLKPLSGKERRFVEDGPNLYFPGADLINAAAGNSLMGMSKPNPFFATEQVLNKYAFRKVTADDEHRKKYGLNETDKPDIYAALYSFKGRTILLVRNFVYDHADFSNPTYMKAYKAILDQWEELVDVLVLDQTHNGGGSYCEEFAKLFLKQEGNGFVQHLNVDRKWIADLRIGWANSINEMTGGSLKDAYQSMASQVEKAYDNGDALSQPLPIIGGSERISPLEYSWKKPMLVLIDELAGSCGDAFPMLIKRNQVAKLFGKKTIGLGGNVETIAPLPFSGARPRITRGLFTSYREDGSYSQADLIENNGVEADYHYSHTVSDFRDGFVKYVETFSEKALEQIK